mgnify:CR=1 FL=1
MHLKDKIAIVTGGSRGIGKEICLKFASLGANLVINYIGDKTQAEDTKAECEKLGAKVALSEGDVSKMADCEKLFQTAMDTFGRVDILVNNAGITRDNLLMRMSEEEFDAVIAVNLKGTFNCMKQAARPMMKQKYGKIINMASVVGVTGNAGQVNYAASKAGIIGFTKSVAKELGSRNIRANAVAPGFIITDMTAQLSEDVRKEWAAKIPLKRGGTPEDIAKVCVFLASDLSAYVTGQTIHVCGGMNM